MRIINVYDVYLKVKQLVKEANYEVDSCLKRKFQEGLAVEKDPLAQNILASIIENLEISREKQIPICQDTGLVVIFLEVGNEINFVGDLYQALNQAIMETYKEEYFRMSVLNHPLERINTFTNTPAIIHEERVNGDKLKITVCPKGAGSENMSQLRMLSLSLGYQGIVDFVLEVVKKAQGNSCPPMQVGVGIGGNFEYAALLSKKALLINLEQENDDHFANLLEKDLFKQINDLDIGPMGVGGKMTAFAVKVLCAPCHIASLPVAVNLQCHAARHREVII